jgi:hypothetical protein
MLYGIGHSFFFADSGRRRPRGTIGCQAVDGAETLQRRGSAGALLARGALRSGSIQEPYLLSFYGDYV